MNITICSTVPEEAEILQVSNKPHSNRCLSQKIGKTTYYGEAKTTASPALASAMRFEQLTPAKAVYTIM